MPEYIYNCMKKNHFVFNAKLSRNFKIVFSTNYTLKLEEEINETEETHEIEEKYN